MNVITSNKQWAISHITSTTMLSLAICLYAITSTIMVMFSKDKSIANNKKSAVDWLPILLFILLEHVTYNTFTKWRVMAQLLILTEISDKFTADIICFDATIALMKPPFVSVLSHLL